MRITSIQQLPTIYEESPVFGIQQTQYLTVDNMIDASKLRYRKSRQRDSAKSPLPNWLLREGVEKDLHKLAAKLPTVLSNHS